MPINSLIQLLQVEGWSHLKQSTLGVNSWRLSGIYQQQARVLTVIYRSDASWRVLEAGKFWRWSLHVHQLDNHSLKSSDSHAPMDGLIRELLVTAGQVVKPQQPLYVLEAMKMQMQVCASSAGIIESVLITAGQSVRQGQQILLIESGNLELNQSKF